MTTDIAQLLKHRRLQMGYSQNDVAQHLGLSHRSLVSRKESGEKEWSFNEVNKLCELLKLDLNIKDKALKKSEIVEAVQRQQKLLTPLQKDNLSAYENWLIEVDLDQETSAEIVKKWKRNNE